jgi:hypothetical protein
MSSPGEERAGYGADKSGRGLADEFSARLVAELSARLVAALATLAGTMGQDLAEADWWRLVDALLLIAAHPAAS